MNKTVRKYIIPVILIFSAIFFCTARQLDRQLPDLMPDIPEEITEPSQRAAFLVMHYWDKYDFGDMTFLMTDDLLERSLVDYLDLLSLVPADTVARSVGRLMGKAEEKRELFLLLSKLSERYLYEPDSPVYDEEKLIPFLQEELKSATLLDIEKIRLQFLLDQILKNRTGEVANDFSYTLADNRTGTLHALQADFILLYFNDPECEDCLLLTGKLIASPVISELIKREQLDLLAVYTGEDVEAWRNHAATVQPSWIYARDAEQRINGEGIYHIRQFPTIYLLDKNKKVLLKETSFETLEAYFRRDL
jgi:hypothetical protein